jgi:hypothetical protein
LHHKKIDSLPHDEPLSSGNYTASFVRLEGGNHWRLIVRMTVRTAECKRAQEAIMKAHSSGRGAAALPENVSELSSEPIIEKAGVIVAKLPG